MEQLPVDTGLDVKALGEAAGHQIAQVPIALLVPAQQDQVGVVVVRAVLLLEAAAGRHIDLAPDDGPDALGEAGLVKGHRAVHDPVVGDGEGGLPQGLGLFGDLVDPAGPVQQGVFGMHMEVDKGHFNSSLWSEE